MSRINSNSWNPIFSLARIALVGLVVLLAGAWGDVSGAQDPPESSPQETEAIKQIEDDGGRVYRISAADTACEVSFYLSSKPIGDEQLKGMNAIGQVVWVNLAGTEVTDQGLQHLAGLPIKKLHLERTKIGDMGLTHLKSFKEMTYLNIYDTQVTDAGLEHLKDLKALKKLFVWKTGVTEEGIKRLKLSLPDLEIVGELKLEPVVVEEPKQEATEKESEKSKDDADKPVKEPAVDGKSGKSDAAADAKSPESNKDVDNKQSATKQKEANDKKKK